MRPLLNTRHIGCYNEVDKLMNSGLANTPRDLGRFPRNNCVTAKRASFASNFRPLFSMPVALRPFSLNGLLRVST